MSFFRHETWPTARMVKTIQSTAIWEGHVGTLICPCPFGESRHLSRGSHEAEAGAARICRMPPDDAPAGSHSRGLRVPDFAWQASDEFLKCPTGVFTHRGHRCPFWLFW